MNLRETVQAIVQVKKSRENANHIWLQGFYDIMDNALLSHEKAVRYLEIKLSENPPFTKYCSSGQMLHLIQSLTEDAEKPKPDLFYVHLPINERYHLEFPMVKQGDDCRFVYTLCRECDKLNDGNGLPEISIRQSVHFKKDRAPAMYDNRISVNHQSAETISKSYDTLEDFVKECRIS